MSTLHNGSGHTDSGTNIGTDAGLAGDLSLGLAIPFAAAFAHGPGPEQRNAAPSGAVSFDATSGVVVSSGTISSVGSGVTLEAPTVLYGGLQFIASGGETVSAVIEAGGQQEVFYGGTASGSILNGGEQTVLIGGNAADTLVLSGGIQQVTAGAVASGTVLSAGGEQLVSGLASSTAVETGGLLYDQGETSGADIASGGVEAVVGGVASATHVESGGILVLFNGGAASGTVVDQGGTVTSAGILVIPDSGAASYASAAASGSVVSAATEYVFGATSVSGQAVGASGSIIVESGAQVIGTVVSSGGTLVLSAGATASGSQIRAYGTQLVSSGAVDSGAVLSGFHALDVAFSGGTIDGATVGFYCSAILDGGTASGLTVGSAGYEYIISGGIAVSGTVLTSGILDVDATSIDSATTLKGTETVLGQAIGDTILVSGLQTIGSGGTASGETVSSGGLLLLQSGAVASGTTVSSGGYVVDLGGGTIVGTILSGGVVAETGVVISSGGSITDNAALLSSAITSAQVYVLNGTALSGIQLGNRTTGTILSGASVTSMTLAAGGTLYEQSGATINGITVKTNAHLYVSGTMSGLVASGAVVEAMSGGVIDNALLTSNTTYIYGGTISGGTVTGSSTLSAYAGSAVGLTVQNSAVLQEWNGAVGIGTHVVSGGRLAVYDGIDSAATIGALGTEYVYSGGTVISGTLASGGVEFVGSSGLVSAANVQSGGWLVVHSGAEIESAVISSGGILLDLDHDVSSGSYTLAGGSVVSTGVVEFAGTLLKGFTPSLLSSQLSDVTLVSGRTYALSGSVLDDVTVGLLTSMFVEGGTVTNTHVVNNGVLDVTSNGVDGTMISRGQEILRSGTEASGGVVSSGGQILATTGSTVTGAQVFLSGNIQLFGSGSEISVSSGGFVNLYGSLAESTIHSGGKIYLNVGGQTSDLSLDLGAVIGVETSGYTPSQVTTSLDEATDTLTISFPTGASVSAHLKGDYSKDYFLITNAPDGSIQLTLEAGTPCFCPGTLIRTDRGEVPVEDLAIGDRLAVASGGYRALRWIGRRSYEGRFLRGRRDILPVTIRAGALADNVPARDLTVSPMHAMYLHGVLVPAGALVNGSSIVQAAGAERVEYLHLELDRHDLLLAEGAATESFVDDGSRGMFHNAAEHARLYPDHVRLPAIYCAPRVEQGEKLDEIRRTLLARIAPDRVHARAS
ncbi:Hint domain-containing protein [Acetobacteraceae bacterium KSS8]|uniref:Hint domain-containing protein n=1 Tax=Endosaccharibacter trunci TaxID=2812733 RepID=A0ABT1W977_9PROT|nr:Hint domain-containing protein [Acetobacteraceae bacterium KSS8]